MMSCCFDVGKFPFARLFATHFLSRGECVPLAATENRADPGPNIWCKTGAGDRITQRECPEDRTDYTTITALFKNKHAVIRAQVDVESLAFRIQSEAFDSNAEVAHKEILDICAAAPGVVP